MPNKRTRPIKLDTLLDPDPDLSLYWREPTDDETEAQISVADLKELLLATSECSRRIDDLALQEVEHLHRHVESIEDRLCAQTERIQVQAAQETPASLLVLKGTLCFGIGLAVCLLIAILPSPWCWIALVGCLLLYTLGAWHYQLACLPGRQEK
jgi:hypothetical protein